MSVVSTRGDNLLSLHATSFDLLEGGRELGPVLHDDDGTSIGQNLLHLLLLVIGIWANVANDLDTGTSTAQGATLAVLNSHSLLGLLAKLVQGVEVDSRVRLAGGLRQTRGSREDDITLEVLVLANLLNASLHTSQSRGRDDRELVLSRGSQLLELVIHARARPEGSLELGNDGVLLLKDVLLHILRGNLDVVDLLEGGEHASEVLADELGDEGLAREAGVKVAASADLVDEIGTCLESELLGENEGVVAVEKEGGDLQAGRSSLATGSSRNWGGREAG